MKTIVLLDDIFLKSWGMIIFFNQSILRDTVSSIQMLTV